MSRSAYEETNVSVERSQAQIRKLLQKFGVERMRYTSLPSEALLEFVRVDKGKPTPYRIVIRPKLKGWSRSVDKELDLAERQVWRVVYWWLKAKLEAIEFGLLEFEREMLPFMLISVSQGRSATVGDVLPKHLQGALSPGEDPFQGVQPALPAGEKDA